MLHCVKLKLKLHLYTLPKNNNNKCGIQPVILTINTKNTHNILHINIIYQSVEYYVIISAKKTNNLNAGSSSRLH